MASLAFYKDNNKTTDGNEPYIFYLQTIYSKTCKPGHCIVYVWSQYDGANIEQ